ncbi:MAG TPA: hypothetical protein VHW45_15415 [Candidatus Sulfotelmatobacter sp.]|nr:hypothetical protein [Candidatus Sulfotelmatobacter sp.]
MALALVSQLPLVRLLTVLLHGVAPSDPLALALAVAILAVIAVLAALLPATRATQVNPMALRYE